MYLKKIETQGFKSFANRAVLEFTPGIMGIVGPNGSGKSNVADAVRWVLGEQSARQLRGSNMQDVIFAGTENRRPMSYAFVSLTIDNSDHALPVDYDEVVVSRQVFRSGESEYRLNGNICRLRDIYETFYDSGIGKEGYSIIGQGQIEMALSNKPEERRLMFDEAAGIVKYKKRRDITLKKLETEKASRERVEDILNELEKQVGPLEKQSAKAKTYLRLRDELKACEVGAFARENAELEQKLDTARENLSVVAGDLETAGAEAEKLKARYDSLNEENETLDKDLARMQAELADLRVTNENREGRISLLEEQIRAAESNRDLIDERLKDYDEAIARLEAEREEYYRQKNEVDRQQDQTDDKISVLEEAAEELDQEQKDLSYQIEKGNQTILSSMDRKAELNGSIAALDVREKQNAERLAEADTEAERESSNEARLKTDQEALAETLKKASERAESLEAKLRGNRQKLTDLTDRKNFLESEINRMQRDLSVLNSRWESLNNLMERYDGYGGSVKAVMERKNRFSGICGVVADLITTEKKYETAVETVLGGRIQNIVTETEDDAKNVIAYLKTNRLGRATFLPLDAVKGDRAPVRAEVLKEPGAIGTAASLVKADARYEGVVRFLLGQTVVTDHLDHALAIARKYDHRLSIVTLEGDYLTPGGVMSGGAYRNSSNLLGRRRELSECKAQEKKLKGELEEAEKACGGVRTELQTLEVGIRKTDASLRDLLMKKAALEVQKKNLDAELKRSSERIRTLKEEKERLLKDNESITRDRLSIRRNAEDLDQGNESLRTQVTELAVKLDRIRGQVQEKNRQLEEMRVAFSALIQKNDHLLENVRRCNEEIARTRGDRNELVRGNTSVADAVKEREEEIRKLKEDLEAARLTMRDLEQACLDKEELRGQKKEEQQEYFESREAISARLSDLDKEDFRLKSLVQRLEEQIEKQAEYLWAEYEMTPSQARAVSDPEIGSPAEVRRFIAQKKKEIKDLGPVYVEAIEKYKEVSERYEFLKAQRDDLVRAEDSLNEMIRDLEKGMRKQFKEQFALIQKEFSKVFSDLFAGGHGNIFLDNEDDVLSAGVIINAQPPGKKLQNMMQLSGGEKTLTAIALLFAIQNLKPSPFCLLDEIEAALDEPNVKRFADYLYRLRGSTQFLIITHRRGTMEMADRLYGITMQEKGVSALVSVSLTDPASREILKEAN